MVEEKLSNDNFFHSIIVSKTKRTRVELKLIIRFNERRPIDARVCTQLMEKQGIFDRCLVKLEAGIVNQNYCKSAAGSMRN